MTKHVHAELMLQYAHDAQETDKPWERWEVYGKVKGRWISLNEGFSFISELKYRRKPKMLSVTLANGEVVSWPEPHRTELDNGNAYYYIDVEGSVINDKWHGVAWDRGALSNGYIHLTKEAAEQHAAALRKINNQGD